MTTTETNQIVKVSTVAHQYATIECIRLEEDTNETIGYWGDIRVHKTGRYWEPVYRITVHQARSIAEMGWPSTAPPGM